MGGHLKPKTHDASTFIGIICAIGMFIYFL